ncbi:MAG: hypothetical protein K9L78_05305 [Victivallales bacterium]|nr:hypothetical protein [Victivallales bacterium]MCF7889518.1 hypothetical protein [Victivallales bacterium]
MDTVVCPYCNSEVDVSLVEAEEGCCPECGSVITPSSIFGNPYEDAYEDNYDGEDDVFEDDEDFLDALDEDDEFMDDIDKDGDF